MSKDIFIKGARMHNLKNVDVTIPRNKLVVVTGVSGSGKSSLTMDTLYAEGQRRYVESLSSYARQFMKTMTKPDMDYIDGLCPAIAIEQKVSARTPRSTVGSLTEINDYLKLLFAKVGRTYSPISGTQVKKDEVADVKKEIEKLKEGDKILLLIRSHYDYDINVLNNLMERGFSRLYNADTKEYINIEEAIEKEFVAKKEKNIFILIDRFVVKTFDEDEWYRISDSLNVAFQEGYGDLYLEINSKKLLHFCNRFEADGIQFETPTPNLFSFNNPYGACPVCEGFGQVLGIDEDLVIPNKNLSVYESAVAPWKGEKLSQYKEYFIRHAKSEDFPIHKPIKELSKEQLEILWNGKGKIEGINHFFKMVEENLYKIQYRVLQARYRGKTKCISCRGSRIRKEALYVKIDGYTIADLTDIPAKDLLQVIQKIKLTPTEKEIAKRILTELLNRLQVLSEVGLGYLTMNRTANTLSGGESQRIQLTRIIGSNLTDSLYILDEPSIGLHSRDTNNLIKVLNKLKALGNTVVVVEHDEQIMREADYIIDMGPLASTQGGEVIAHGNYATIIKNKKSLTGKYLNGDLKIEPQKQNATTGNKITLTDCTHHNLQNITVQIPLNALTVVTGVSGSGKTTLIKHILYPALLNKLGDYSEKPGAFGEIQGDIKAIAQVEMVDQNPIGKSSRSNPVTYIKAYDDIRDLYTNQQLSKIRGYKPGHFSYNVEGGRCDNCNGEGETIVEMQFLADVHITCEVCNGKRFKEEILEITYKEKNIAQILEMSVDESIVFFEKEKKLVGKLQALQDVGLGYIALGQSSSTLSGGEAQRVKLASFLLQGNNKSKILFIFDEPTTGLHFHDINKLLKSFSALIKNGHSILVIEHNTDVIKNADWVIDLGPEAGDKGGNLVYQGKIDGLKKAKESFTGKWL